MHRVLYQVQLIAMEATGDTLDIHRLLDHDWQICC